MMHNLRTYGKKWDKEDQRHQQWWWWWWWWWWYVNDENICVGFYVIHTMLILINKCTQQNATHDKH